jgi:hypothetical protein
VGRRKEKPAGRQNFKAKPRDIMKKLLITVLIALSLSSTAQAKAKPKPQTPPPVAGSCKLDKGIWIGHCQTVPPIKIPINPKPGKVEKAK